VLPWGRPLGCKHPRSPNMVRPPPKPQRPTTVVMLNLRHGDVALAKQRGHPCSSCASPPIHVAPSPPTPPPPPPPEAQPRAGRGSIASLATLMAMAGSGHPCQGVVVELVGRRWASILCSLWLLAHSPLVTAAKAHLCEQPSTEGPIRHGNGYPGSRVTFSKCRSRMISWPL
jgi:hypothetical protein